MLLKAPVYTIILHSGALVTFSVWSRAEISSPYRSLSLLQYYSLSFFPHPQIASASEWTSLMLDVLTEAINTAALLPMKYEAVVNSVAWVIPPLLCALWKEVYHNPYAYAACVGVQRALPEKVKAIGSRLCFTDTERSPEKALILAFEASFLLPFVILCAHYCQHCCSALGIPVH